MSNSEEQYLFLLHKYLQGDATEEDKSLLLELAKDDPDKMVLLHYLTFQPTEKEALEAEVLYEKTKPNDLVSMESLSLEAAADKPTLKFSRYKLVAIAVGIIGLLLSGLYFYKMAEVPRQEWQIISTKRGERKFLTFKDGTEVWLNNESELKVLKGFGIQHRKMELKGEGYFAVAKNKKLPFTVKTKDTEVNVLGTVFNLNAYPDNNSTTTSLIEGKVVLKLFRLNGNKDIVMKPGDQVKISKNNVLPSALSTKPQAEIQDAVTYKKIEIENDKSTDMLWVENKLVFNDEPFAEIVQKLERWYNKRIIIQNKELLQHSLSGTFEEKDCTQVLDIFQKIGIPLHYRIHENNIYIY